MNLLVRMPGDEFERVGGAGSIWPAPSRAGPQGERDLRLHVLMDGNKTVSTLRRSYLEARGPQITRPVPAPANPCTN